MEQQQKILTFWDHLEELRHVLFRIAVAVVFLMLGGCKLNCVSKE